MKYWYDCEFYENGTTIDLISIGMVSEDGRRFYAVNKECDFSKVSDWVLDNVLKPMGLDRSGFNNNASDHFTSANYRNTLQYALPKKWIAKNLMGFIKPWVNYDKHFVDLDYDKLHKTPIEDKVQLWAYYADYDHVCLCQLFGTMMDLPVGFPMYTLDIKQLCDDLGNFRLPIQDENEHNALADAIWNRQAYEFLKNKK